MTQQNKGTLIVEVEVPAAHEQTHFYVLIIGFFRCLGLIIVLTSGQL